MKASICCLALGMTAFAGVRQPSPFGQLPLRFEENRGQEAAPVRYIARGNRFNVLLTATGNSIRWKNGALETTLVGANPEVPISGLNLIPAATNYFKGNDPKAWKTDIPSYARLRYSQIYPGIDMVFYGREGRLEYDFVVKPGANPSAIQWRLSGFEALRINDAGELVVTTPLGDIQWKAPEIYQDYDSRRVKVNGGFSLKGDRVSFDLGPYDRSRELIIDPVLSFSTFLGGTKNDGASRVAVDSNGNVYITGTTVSQDLPVTKTSFQPAFGGTALGSVVGVFAGDVFVAKFSSSGALSYLTYLGGSVDEAALGIAVDVAGNAYVAGYTNSNDFPMAGTPLQGAFGGFGGNFLARFGDAFVAKISPAGDKLLYSTFLGGRSDDMAMAIKVDQSSNMYVTGWTLSGNFPITDGAYQSPLRGSGGQSNFNRMGVPLMVTGDVFVSKISADGSHLVFSSIVGGSLDDIATSLALDSTNNVYVGGTTISTNFPVTPGSFQQTNHGVDAFNDVVNSGDGFVLKLDSAGQKLVYATYLGGRGDDSIGGLTVDSTGAAYVTGATNSSDFPSTNRRGYQGPSASPFTADFLFGDGFITKIKPDGSGLAFSTFIGGTQDDEGVQIALDPAGNIFVAGSTASIDFPVTSNALQPKFGGGGLGADIYHKADGFLMMLSPAGDQTIYSSYLGGALGDVILGLAVDNVGNAYVTGFSTSADFPVTAGAFQKNHTLTMDNNDAAPTAEDQADVFVTKIAGLTTGPFISAVVNAASNAQGGVSPGMITVMYGNLIGPTVTSPVLAAIDPNSGLLATTRSNTTFFFDTVPAPIVYVSATQSAAIVPYEVAGKGSTQLTVQYNGQTSPPLTLTVADTQPGLFSLNFSGSGPGAIFNQDNTPNSAANPAKKGQVIQLFGTGEGILSPALKTGQIAPATPPFPTTAAILSATVGGITASTVYVGPVPGNVAGLLQVNLIVPTTVASGNQPVVVQVGANHSQASLTVAVQ